MQASLRKLQRGFKTWEEPGLFALEGEQVSGGIGEFQDLRPAKSFGR